MAIHTESLLHMKPQNTYPINRECTTRQPIQQLQELPVTGSNVIAKCHFLPIIHLERDITLKPSLYIHNVLRHSNDVAPYTHLWPNSLQSPHPIKLPLSAINHSLKHQISITISRARRYLNQNIEYANKIHFSTIHCRNLNLIRGISMSVYYVIKIWYFYVCSKYYVKDIPTRLVTLAIKPKMKNGITE